jgi:hypothetical protein
MDNIERITELFDQAVALTQRYAEVCEAQEAFEKGAQPPERKSQYESLDEYAAHLQAQREYQREKNDLAAARHNASRALDDLASEILKFLPSKVWFRHGDVGVGISYTNWGGNHYGVKVAPWQEDMLSLDHTYHGD